MSKGWWDSLQGREAVRYRQIGKKARRCKGRAGKPGKRRQCEAIAFNGKRYCPKHLISETENA